MRKRILLILALAMVVSVMAALGAGAAFALGFGEHLSSGGHAGTGLNEQVGFEGGILPCVR